MSITFYAVAQYHPYYDQNGAPEYTSVDYFLDVDDAMHEFTTNVAARVREHATGGIHSYYSMELQKIELNVINSMSQAQVIVAALRGEINSVIRYREAMCHFPGEMPQGEIADFAARLKTANWNHAALT